eukprot:1190261-Prorocentrum_minimum.AAC.1
MEEEERQQRIAEAKAEQEREESAVRYCNSEFLYIVLLYFLRKCDRIGTSCPTLNNFFMIDRFRISEKTPYEIWNRSIRVVKGEAACFTNSVIL